MAIIPDVHTNFTKITSEEISDYLDSDFSQRSDFIADMISFTKERGENNTTPKIPGTIGVKSLIDGGSFWTTRANLGYATVYTSSFPLSTNLNLTANGTNGAELNISQQYSNAVNTDTTKANVNVSGHDRATAGLTSDMGLVYGGRNSGAITNNDAYINSSNSWAVRTVTGGGGAYSNSLSFTSDLCTYLVDAGHTIYSYSANNWTSITGLGTIQGAACFSFSSDLAMASMGWNGAYSGYSTRYSRSLNTWTTRQTGIPNFACSGFSLSSDLGMVSNGNNGSINLSTNIRFSDSANSWSYKLNTPNASLGSGPVAPSLNSSVGLICGGNNGTYSVNRFRYTDNQVALLSGLDIATNQYNNTPAVPDTTASQQVVTKTLTTTIPNKILVSGILSQLDTSLKPTVDVSGDGGTTWGITNKYLDTTISTSALSGNDLRLRITLPRLNYFKFGQDYVGANIWVVKNSMNVGRRRLGGALLTSDVSLSFGGGNAPVLATTESFSETNNSWTTKGNLIYARWSLTGSSLTSDLTISSGGNNGVISYLSERFSNSSNTWIQRGNLGSVRYGGAAAALTSNLSLTFGGDNNSVSVTNFCDRYDDTINTWSTRNYFSVPRVWVGGASLDSDKSLAFAGYNNVNILNTDRYSDSANSWTSRLNTIMSKNTVTGASLTSDICLETGGEISGGPGGYSLNTSRFHDSGNIWVVRASMSVAREACGSSSYNSSALMFGGGNGSYLSLTERYIDGETYFKGFAVKFA